MSESQPETSHVWLVPRTPRVVGTPFGEATVTVGSGAEQVVAIVSPHGATVLAALLSRVQLRDHEAELRNWRDHLVIDLVSSAALSDPRTFRQPAHVRLEGTAR